jgi:5'-nucleotidase / UDP-sugar diphosphatase
LRKYTNVIILGLLVLGLAGYLISVKVKVHDVLLSMNYYEDKIAIINTADVHGHLIYELANGGYYSVDEVNVQMGLPLIKTLVDELRSKHEHSLFIDSGDLFHGTNEANEGEGQGVVEAVNLLGYDAMVAGNHDFNFGFDRLKEIEGQLNFPILTANVLKEGKPVFEQYKVVDIGGKKLGLFGLTVPESRSNMNITDSNSHVEFEDPEVAARRVIPILKEQGVDAIILISHLGDDIDAELVKVVDGIDLVLSGHHHWLYKEAKKVNNTYIVEAGSYSTHVGLAQVYFKNGKVSAVDWEVLQESDKTKQDPEVAAVAEKYHQIALEKGKEIVGHSKVKLNGIRSQVRTKETNLANLLTDAMREEAQADITLMNGGGIRESIPDGDISLYDIGRPLPFVNSTVTVELPGEKIYQALERGLREWPHGANNGGFLHVSGISYTFDGSKPAGERLVRVMKDGQPLDQSKLYKVVTNDYLANGGDNYEEFRDARLISSGKLLREVLADYIRKKGSVEPQVEGRIEIVNERYK